MGGDFVRKVAEESTPTATPVRWAWFLPGGSHLLVLVFLGVPAGEEDMDWNGTNLRM